MANIQLLVAELTNDPEGFGYAGMTNAQVVQTLNAENRAKNKDSITGDEVFQATDSGEWAGLTDLKKQLWMSFCGRQIIDPFASANVQLVQYIFAGLGGQTIANLGAIRVESVSRAEELGYPGRVRLGHVERARAAMGV